MTSITKPIPDPALGERALAVQPRLAPGGDAADFAAQGWGRRTRYVAGRSVTDRALVTDQRNVEGHIATAGQRLAPGVVVGLEVTIEGTRSEPILHIAPGFGVCLNGEDVRVPYPVEIPARALVVAGAGPGEDPTPLLDLLGADLAVARVLVVQLRPVVVERTGDDDADDPCELDPDAIAFTDEQLVDGCRIRLFPVTVSVSPPLATWRNEITYALFEREAADGLEQLPWHGGGLPIALLGFPPGDTQAPFVDVHAVARAGGQANPRQPRVLQSGTLALHQARFEQFTAQLGDGDVEALAASGLGTEFRWLPPVGMLPPGTIDVRGDLGEPDFPLPAPGIFPDEYVLEAVPVELESLDDYLHASAALAPFDTLAREQIQVLVPVPQQHFDPDLLIVEDETPDEFRDAIERFLLVLNHRLGRRFLVRAAQRHIGGALDGVAPIVADEPQAVTGEITAFFPVDQVLVDAGLPVPPPEVLTGGDVTPMVVALVTDMFNAVGGPANGNPTNPLSALLRAAYVAFGGSPSTVMSLQQNTAAELVDFFVEQRFGGRGIVGFADFALRQLVIASERITLAFERLQAELHRIREYVSGTQAANQLASSPVVSAIARRDPSAKPPLQLSAFATALRAATVVDGRPPAGLTVTTTVPTAGISTGGRPIASSLLFSRDLLARLDSSPPAFDASANADRATREALRTILFIHDDLGLSLDGIAFPERLFNRAETNPPLGDGDLVTIDVVREEIRRWLEEGTWEHEFDEVEDNNNDTSEARFFGNAVRRLEEMVGVLRIAEARLTAFEAAVDLMRDTNDRLHGLATAVTRRLAELQDEIDELRHDIRVARALEREEMARAVRLNQLRAQVIAEHVPFLVFRRPRSVDAVRVPPAIALGTAADPDIVPDCLDDDVVPPEQLSAMLDLVRELPVNRVKIGVGIVQQIDRQAPLVAVADFVLARALAFTANNYQPFASSVFADRVGTAAKARYTAHRTATEQLRPVRGQRIAQAAHRTLSWSRLQSLVHENATIADVLDAPHGELKRVRPLSQELENLSRVATCLYEKFHEVPPIVRLAWVQQVSEEDENVIRLDDLSKLPEWESVDRILRRDLQSLIDWLFGRFEPVHDDGLAYVSDLVRVALLLSGHAPVQQVLDGVVVAPQPVAPGGLVRLQIDPARVRVGMHVALYSDSARTIVAGTGIVDDLADGVVAVKMVATTAATVVPTHALVSEPSRGPKVTLAGGRTVSIGIASKLS